MPTYTAAVLPNTNGLTLGSSSLRWAPFLTNPDITGTITYSGALSGITTISTSGSITSASQLISTVATGTIPVSVLSTTKCTNLNADLLDGNDWAAPAAIGSTTPAAANFTTVGASGVITSTVSTGTAPFTVASTTQVANLNATQLVGASWISPGTIGSTTPSTGAFTTLSASTSATIGGGTAITKIKVYTQALTPAIVNANTGNEQAFTVTGLTTADQVVVTKPTLQTGLIIHNARVSANDTLQISFANCTAGNLTPTAGEVYTIIAFRS